MSVLFYDIVLLFCKRYDRVSAITRYSRVNFYKEKANEKIISGSSFGPDFGFC